MSDLTISIAMCTYNGEKYLQEQLDSIFNQTRLPDELVVFDDNSSDQSISILERFSASTCFPVKIFKNQVNIGSTKNFEKAIIHCGGDIIALADQDDVWQPNKLEIIQRSFEMSPKIGFFFSDANVTDEYMTITISRLWKSVDFSYWSRMRLVNGKAFDVLLNHNVVTGATMAFRSELKEKVVPIPSRWVHDGWIAIIASAITDLTICAEGLIEYRQHLQQQIGVPNQGLIEKYEVSKATRPEGYMALADDYRDVYQRLCLFSEDSGLEVMLSKVRGKIKHLQARSEITQNGNYRFTLALRELFSLRYFFYSRGIYSFLKDCRSILK